LFSDVSVMVFPHMYADISESARKLHVCVSFIDIFL
jgi:hypothetical protein